jgi:hypothetical protein
MDRHKNGGLFFTELRINPAFWQSNNAGKFPMRVIVVVFKKNLGGLGGVQIWGGKQALC